MRIMLSVTVAASALAPLTKRLGTPARIVVVSSAYDVEGGEAGAVSSAPYDIEEPAAEPTKDVAALKSKLFAACAAADRGFAASPADRDCLLYTSPSPRDGLLSRMPSSA